MAIRKSSGADGRSRGVRFEEDDVQTSRWTWNWHFPSRRKRAQKADAVAKETVARAPWVPRYAARDALMSEPWQHPDQVVARERKRTLNEIGFAPVAVSSDSHIDRTSARYSSRTSRSMSALPPAKPGLPAAAAVPLRAPKHDSVVKEDAIAETLRLLTASASERGMTGQTSARIPRWRGRRQGSLYAYDGAELCESHGPMTDTQASEVRMLQGLGLAAPGGYGKVGAYGLSSRPVSIVDPPSPSAAMMSRYDMYAARHPQPQSGYIGMGKQALKISTARQSSPHVSPMTRVAPSLPCAPRSNDSLDSSAAGTAGTTQTATPRGPQSTAATSLEIEERDNTTAEKDNDDQRRDEDDVDQAVYYGVENILAWL